MPIRYPGWTDEASGSMGRHGKSGTSVLLVDGKSLGFPKALSLPSAGSIGRRRFPGAVMWNAPFERQAGGVPRESTRRDARS